MYIRMAILHSSVTGLGARMYIDVLKMASCIHINCSTAAPDSTIERGHVASLLV